MRIGEVRIERKRLLETLVSAWPVVYVTRLWTGIWEQDGAYSGDGPPLS